MFHRLVTVNLTGRSKFTRHGSVNIGLQVSRLLYIIVSHGTFTVYQSQLQAVYLAL